MTERAELLASLALRVFGRDELLEILETAACSPQGRLRGLVEYLSVAEHGKDEREAQAVAQPNRCGSGRTEATARELGRT
jgi:hypothetical protein